MSTILILDNDPNFRALIFNMFSPEHVVLEAGDELEGIAMFDLVRPDLVITNQDLPGSLGLELIKGLRALSKDVKIIAIASSYYSSEHYTSKEHISALDAGADLCIRKTMTTPELKYTISNLIVQIYNPLRLVDAQDRKDIAKIRHDATTYQVNNWTVKGWHDLTQAANF
jgi:DNA-binding response OmpR family regulator